MKNYTSLGNKRFELKLDDLVYEEENGKKIVHLGDNIDLTGLADETSRLSSPKALYWMAATLTLLFPA